MTPRPTAAQAELLREMALGMSLQAAVGNLYDRGVLVQRATINAVSRAGWIGPQTVLGVRVTLITDAGRAAVGGEHVEGE